MQFAGQMWYNPFHNGAPQAVFSADPAAELDDLYRRSVSEK